ncbi:MAG TPA: HEAT repeat domain-containing protein, partial [Spirochaetota bacterium]|nr:HEAT repeat domain-containing protein [Spirochaetota bacterium]
FYTPATDMWRWKMNVARAMGNSNDDRFIPELIAEFNNTNDQRVQGMIAWALGKIGGVRAGDALHRFRAGATHSVLHEIERALDYLHHY